MSAADLRFEKNSPKNLKAKISSFVRILLAHRTRVTSSVRIREKL